MRYITIHWTAGSYTSKESSHYHFTVGKNGEVYPGNLPPEANIPPLRGNDYVKHCGGGNSWNIGIAARGMGKFKSAKEVGEYPLTAVQCERLWKLAAELAFKYKIPVDDRHIFTHYAFGKRNPRTSSAGKIDITHLPHKPELNAEQVQDYILNKVRWYYQKLQGEV